MTDELRTPTVTDFIDAGAPCLFLKTVNNKSCEELVRKIIKNSGINFDFYIWKTTTGLITDDEEKRADDIIESLRFIQDNDKREGTNPIAAIFHNARHFMPDYELQQQIIDSVEIARLKGSHLIFVGPCMDIPPELQNIIITVDIPLPTKEELKEQYSALVKAYAGEIDIPSGKKEKDQLILSAANSALGMDPLSAENAFALSLAMTGGIDVRVIQKMKEQEVKKAGALEFIKTAEPLTNVGGFNEYKSWIERRKMVFTDEARKFGLPFPKGVLLVGVPGSGKSLLAKATANYLVLPLLRLDMGKVFRPHVGESEGEIRIALRTVEAISPCVLWIDEIEKGLAGARRSELNGGVAANVLSIILTWRVETTYPVMLVATSNDVGALPPELYRKGRIDEIWATDLPTRKERAEILSIHIKKRKRNPKNFDIDQLALECNEFVGAEIEGCIEDALFMAFSVGEDLNDSFIRKAISETVPQATRDRESITMIRNWCSDRARNVSSEQESVITGRKKVRSINIKQKLS